MAQDQRFSTAPFSRRRFLQYSGSMALSGSLLAACAGTGGSGASSSGGGSGSLPNLQHWYHQYGEVGTHEAVLKYAKQYTKANVTVNWVPGTGDEYPNKVRAALLGSNPPDVFENSALSVDQVKAGLIAPLDDLIADVKSDFNPVSAKPFTVDGKVYGIKMINDPTFVYYRKSLFQKAGLQPPTTITELIAAAKKLTSGTMKGIYIGPDGGVNALRYIAGWSSGGDFISDDNKIVFNTDRMAQAYEQLKALNASGGVLPDAPTFWWDPSSFTQGTVAMQFCGLWAMPGIKKALGDDFGIFAWPALDAKSQPATVVGGWAEMVSAKSKNLQAAKDYVKWLWVTNSDVQIDWNVGYGFHVPPRASIAAKTTKLQTPPASDAVDIMNKYGHNTPATWNAAMESVLTDAVSNIVKNKVDPLATLNTAADKCNTELKKILG
ncbi:MAG TPA: sugar ABC transporter substrate-binding protein [Ktedonobacteraceae bacterium]|nr:sugar ABC transporter substrate-binding protein [Ktedonobacteraceae bacterium]